MRRPLRPKRKNSLGEASAAIGGLLSLAGLLVLLRMLPPWFMWAVVGLTMMVAGGFLLINGLRR